jgi:hypothetical protein
MVAKIFCRIANMSITNGAYLVFPVYIHQQKDKKGTVDNIGFNALKATIVRPFPRRSNPGLIQTLLTLILWLLLLQYTLKQSIPMPYFSINVFFFSLWLQLFQFRFRLDISQLKSIRFRIKD